MRAYYVTNPNYDVVVVPEAGRFVQVDADLLRSFLGDDPKFEAWGGEELLTLQPSDFGRVIATREGAAAPTILDQEAWNARVFHYIRPRR